jgi:hypothetical protein
LVDTGFVGDVSEHGLSSGRSTFSGDFELIDIASAGTGARSLLSPAQKILLMWLPKEENEFNDLCLSLIGQGPTFCIRKNCQVLHQG